MKNKLNVMWFSILFFAHSFPGFAKPVPLQLLTEHKPPGTYRNAQGEVTGATVELIRLLQQRLDEPGNIELLPWARAFSMAKAGPGIGIFETIRNPSREGLFKWVGPLKQYKVELYGRSERLTENRTLMLRRVTACEYRHSALVDDLLQLGFKPETNLILTTKHGDCYNMLIRGRVDAIALTSNNVAQKVKQFAEQGVTLVPMVPITEVKMYLAFSLDVDDARVARWQKALDQSYLDGSMRKLYLNVYPDQMIEQLEAGAGKQVASEVDGAQ